MKTIQIPVPEWANWWTVDADGLRCFWEKQPHPESYNEWHDDNAGNFMNFGYQSIPEDWTKELHRIE